MTTTARNFAQPHTGLEIMHVSKARLARAVDRSKLNFSDLPPGPDAYGAKRLSVTLRTNPGMPPG
jgi:hypothetical protein